MRSVHAMAGIASAGLLAASLVMGAPASAMNTVNGTGGDDHLRGTLSSDTIRGFGGNDHVYALAGADLISVGSGHDNVVAGRGDDTIRGGIQGDWLGGGVGDDTIYGGAGGETIYGDAGSDVIFGGTMGEFFIVDGRGTDTIYGGLGGDRVNLTKDGTPDAVTCGSGKDQVWGATSENTIAGDCEEVHVERYSCRVLPQRVLPPLREARCG
ncbi:MAG: calcium-binding protein [Nocardioidaceae bacterium]